MKHLVLYNPHSDNERGKENAEELSTIYSSDELQFVDMTTVGDYKAFFDGIPVETQVIICGGDGTLNRFVNDTNGICVKNKLFYWRGGSGNDFARDIGDNRNLIPLDNYIKDLPVVCVKGKEYRFINGVGFGIDGYCCERGDEIREKNPKKKINYTIIAIKGLLFHYKPTKAVVTVDGKTFYYNKVWLAPTMHGRYYGGGMMPAPEQKRNNLRKKVSVMVFYGSSKLKTLCIFPSIFSGEHVKKNKNVTVLSGNIITVKFQEPRALQIDGETIKGVTEYTVKTAGFIADDRRRRMG